MYPDDEIRHLIDLMPASGRMKVKIVNDLGQPQVILAELPKPWQPLCPITINFDLWSQFDRGQRDLVFLRTVCWVTQTKLLKPDLYQWMAAAGLVGLLFELAQTDAIGILTAGGLIGIAGTQIWRSTRSPKAEIEADEAGIRVALRRGYTEPTAAQALLTGIEAVASLERRPLSFAELLRCQNLKRLAGLSTVEVPETARDL